MRFVLIKHQSWHLSNWIVSSRQIKSGTQSKNHITVYGISWSWGPDGKGGSPQCAHTHTHTLTHIFLNHCIRGVTLPFGTVYKFLGSVRPVNQTIAIKIVYLCLASTTRTHGKQRFFGAHFTRNVLAVNQLSTSCSIDASCRSANTNSPRMQHDWHYLLLLLMFSLLTICQYMSALTVTVRIMANEPLLNVYIFQNKWEKK